MDEKITPAAAMAAHGLTVEAVFVPWSMSRNKDEKRPSLNWVVALKKGGRTIVSTDYMAGEAHCPSFKLQSRRTVDQDNTIKAECETGRGRTGPHRIKRILPKPEDVVHSLIMDADVLEYATFEDWAASFGYETDSRKAEAIYRACLEIALKLRNGLGEATLAALRTAFEDY